MAPRPTRRGSSLPNRGGPLLGGRGNQPGPSRGGVQIGSHPGNVVATVGVKRPGYGTAGRPVRLLVNACPIGIPQKIIHHYDVVISPPKDYPPALAHRLIDQLQRARAPEIFRPVGVYDGKKNLYMPHDLNFGKDDNGKPIESKTFELAVPKDDPAKPPTIYSIALTKAATVNPEVLQNFVDGKQAEDESVLTVVMVMNIAVGQVPKSRFPGNSRSFFPGDVKKAVGHGLELQRGYFQSVRPTIGRVILNFDITTGMFYKSGNLITVALDFFGENNPMMLAPVNGFSPRRRHELELFVSGMHVKVWTADGRRKRTIMITHLSSTGADGVTFDWRDHGPTTVANYFQSLQNRPLDYPGVICAVTARGETFPLEKCEVVEGQLARKQAPEAVVAEMVKFSQKKPNERMDAVKDGLNYLGHVESEYIKNFGMTLDAEKLPMGAGGRVIPPPKLAYGEGGRQKQVEPKFGSWNMMDTKLVDPKPIKRWALVVFQPVGAFGDPFIRTVAQDIVHWFGSVGMEVQPVTYTYRGNAQDVPGGLSAAVEGYKCGEVPRFPLFPISFPFYLSC